MDITRIWIPSTCVKKPKRPASIHMRKKMKANADRRKIVKQAKPTNADRIRNMSDEGLAKLIAGEWCEIVCPGAKFYCCGDCEKHILDWLKQEARDD